MPCSTAARQFKQAALAYGYQISAACLFESEHVASLKPGALLFPVLTTIVRIKHSAKLAVVDHPDVENVRILCVGENRIDVAMRVSMVGRCEAGRTVVAGQHAATIRRQQNTLRVAGINEHIVHYDFRVANALPRLALVAALPQSLSGSG